jgi:hypothetical protein
MNITTAMIIDRLSLYQITLPALYSSSIIKGVQLMDALQNIYSNDILYLAYDDVAPQHSIPPNIIYIQSGQSVSESDGQDQNCRIILHSDAQPHKILEDIYAVFLFYKAFFDDMIFALDKNDALQIIAEQTAECLGNPVFVYDNDLHILAFSKTHRIENNAIVAHTTRLGFVDMTGDHSHILRKNIEECRHNDNAFIFSHPGLEYRNISKNIDVGGKRVGLIQLFETQKALTKGMMDAIDSISFLFSIDLQRNYLLRSSLGMLNNQFIIDLLENKIHSSESIAHRINGLNWKIPKNIFVLCVSPQSDFLTNAQLARIQDRIAAILKFSKGIIYEGNIVMILGRENENPFDNGLPDSLKEMLRKMNLNAGLSLCANSLTQTHKLYLQALRAIKLGVKKTPGKHLYFFSDYLTHAFFDACFQIDDLDDYCHPLLVKLQEYDEKHHSSLLETLRQFTINRNNQIVAAKCLNIHRSTLLYRVQKIEKMMDIHLDDPETLFHVLLSLKLKEYMNIYNS